MPSPEELARQNIDALLEKCGWTLQTRSTINPDTARGIAIREALLKGGDEVDCLLLVKISICLCLLCDCRLEFADGALLLYERGLLFRDLAVFF
jgi:hypothetical protein